MWLWNAFMNRMWLVRGLIVTGCSGTCCNGEAVYSGTGFSLFLSWIKQDMAAKINTIVGTLRCLITKGLWHRNLLRYQVVIARPV